MHSSSHAFLAAGSVEIFYPKQRTFAATECGTVVVVVVAGYVRNNYPRTVPPVL